MNRAEQFVEAFARFWRSPETSELSGVLHDDVRLTAPMMPDTGGLAQAREAFARIFHLLPGMNAEVKRWGAEGANVFIEFTMEARLARDRISWTAIDRFTLRGDKAVERVSYFDPTPLVFFLLRHPTLWLKSARALRGVIKSPAPAPLMPSE